MLINWELPSTFLVCLLCTTEQNYLCHWHLLFITLQVIGYNGQLMKATELISIKALAIIIGDVTVTYHFFQHISSFTLWRVINASSGRTWHCLFHMMPWQGLLEYQSRALITLIGKSLLPECSFIESDTFGGISFEAIVVSLRTTVHFLISTRNAWLQSSKLKREGTQPNLKEAKNLWLADYPLAVHAELLLSHA